MNVLNQLDTSVQGIADEGTPPRDMGDTYSQSTDPSDDEAQDRGLDDINAAGPSNHVPQSRVASGNRPARGIEEAQNRHTSSSPHAQPAHQHESLQLESSVTLDTQHDPAEDADMQEGGIGVTRDCLHSLLGRSQCVY